MDTPEVSGYVILEMARIGTHRNYEAGRAALEFLKSHNQTLLACNDNSLADIFFTNAKLNCYCTNR